MKDEVYYFTAEMRLTKVIEIHLDRVSPLLPQSSSPSSPSSFLSLSLLSQLLPIPPLLLSFSPTVYPSSSVSSLFLSLNSSPFLLSFSSSTSSRLLLFTPPPPLFLPLSPQVASPKLFTKEFNPVEAPIQQHVKTTPTLTAGSLASVGEAPIIIGGGSGKPKGISITPQILQQLFASAAKVVIVLNYIMS